MSWTEFKFYHGFETGHRLDGTTIELIPTNGRSGWWDIFQDDEWTGESRNDLAEAKTYAEGMA